MPGLRRILARDRVLGRRAAAVWALLCAACGGGGGDDAGWQSLGPEAATVSALAVDPLAPDVVYAATLNGVYRSRDGGDAWTSVSGGLPADRAMSLLELAPSDPGVLYAASSGDAGVFRSLDGGSRWEALGFVPAGRVATELAIHPRDPMTLYASAFSCSFECDGFVFKSTDGGRTGRTVFDTLEMPGFRGREFLSAAAIDPTEPEVVYTAGTVGLFKSADAGQQWASVDTGASAAGVLLLAMDPGGTLYAQTLDGLRRSSDQGSNWSPANAGLTDGPIQTLAFGAAGSGVVYAGTYGGLYRSLDGASSWAFAALADVEVSAVAIDPRSNSTLYAGSRSTGVLKSRDAGASWTAASRGIVATAARNVAVAPSDPDILYVITEENGLFRSTDAGATWRAVNTGLPRGIVGRRVVVDPARPDFAFLIAASGPALFKTENGGASWSEVLTSSGLNFAPDFLVFDPRTPGALYAANLFGVVRSTDRGATWALTGTTPSDMPPKNYVGVAAQIVAIDPAGPSTLYATASYFTDAWFTDLLKTTDAGQTWSVVHTDLGAFAFSQLVVAPGRSSTLYAVGEAPTLTRSLDGGATWSALYDSSPFGVLFLVADPGDPDTLYVVTRRPDGPESEVLQLRDGAVMPLHEGLPSGAKILSLAASAVSHGLYVGTDGPGVFVRPLD